MSLGDTIGVGSAGSVRKMLDAVLSVAPPEKLAVHMHDTYGQALANVLVAIEVYNIIDHSSQNFVSKHSLDMIEEFSNYS